jgi:hypothetical protein
MATKGIIEVDPRHTIRRMRTGMQGDVIRALVELITNADDSYIRIEEKGNIVEGKIEIIYNKIGNMGYFAVRDHAEGMSINDVEKNFKKYGSSTSGLKMGKKVRGYFGQGAKDALASMIDGEICTFKNGKFTNCKLFIEEDKPMYEICDPVDATIELRNQYKIYNDGTIASFKAHPRKTGRVPRFNTLHQEIANHYMLRKIMTNPHRKVTLKNTDTKEYRKLGYINPIGQEIFSEDFSVYYKKYGNFPIHISISRAETELNQSGDDRNGGLLIIDEEQMVLGISLFKYENEPLASNFFGEVRISHFRELLLNEEPVLSEERNGLQDRHPFCELLKSEVDKRINKMIEKERERKQKEERSKVDPEEAKRYRKAFTLLNEIAEIETKNITFLGQRKGEEIEKPPNGFCIYPSSAQMTIGKRYAFELRVDSDIVPSKTTVKVFSNSTSINILTPQIEISKEDHDKNKIIRKYISVEGLEPNIDAIIQAKTNNKISEARIYILPEKELLLSEGMAFQPETITLQPNRARKVNLLVYVKMIESGSKIQLAVDNDAINVSKDCIIVNELDANRHIATYELEVWGEGEGQNALIEAKFQNYLALLQIKIRTKEEINKGKKGMFNEPQFNFDIDPLQRSSYSSETGEVIIYVNFPTVRHYLGSKCQFKQEISSQVFIADIVAERCFYEIARKSVLSRVGFSLSQEAVPDRIQRDAFKFSSKYGEKVHQALVDQNLLKESRKYILDKEE